MREYDYWYLKVSYTEITAHGYQSQNDSCVERKRLLISNSFLH